MLNGKKAVLARALAAGRVPQMLKGRSPADLIILAYHRVLDVSDEHKFAADPELVSASVEGFRLQLEHISAFWRPISLAVALDSLLRGEALPPRSVAVTFDDGHVDNYTHAFPLLQHYGVPATVFLSTGYVGGASAFWFDRVATLVQLAPTGAYPIFNLDQPLLLASSSTRRAEKDRILERLKAVPNETRLSMLASLEGVLGPYAASQAIPSGVLDWSQVREMASGGIDFGSHTVSHPVLSRQSDSEVYRELKDSRATIERVVERGVDLLAYPVGKPYTYDERVVRIARECGYRAALAYVDGVVNARTMDAFALRRISVERYYSHDQFVARMCLPGIFV